MPILWNDISSNSKGGTELLCRRLEAALPTALMDEVQIIPSRLHGDLDETKVRILWLHDLPQDPESQKILGNRGWEKFHMIVCVSQWQLQRYIEAYQIPWSRCCVIPNSILPIEPGAKSDDRFDFIYHTTPHRGLELLVPVFKKLYEDHGDKVHLHVYSSFDIYGWPERNAQFQPVFDEIEKHDGMTYYGFQSNEVVREALTKVDCFAYPSIWPETSCMALMEAMSAGCLCIHPNYGALAETGANWTSMYQYQDEPNRHAGLIHSVMDAYVRNGKEGHVNQLRNQKAYADIFYNWNNRQAQWVDMINSLISLPREFPKPMFHYKVG